MEGVGGAPRARFPSHDPGAVETTTSEQGRLGEGSGAQGLETRLTLGGVWVRLPTTYSPRPASLPLEVNVMGEMPSEEPTQDNRFAVSSKPFWDNVNALRRRSHTAAGLERGSVHFSTFPGAGSALRTGGGYAHAELYVLEKPPPESAGEGSTGRKSEVADSWGRRKSSSATGFLASLEVAAKPKRRSFNRFQTCTKAVLMQVHSLRKLGHEQLTFSQSLDPSDVSYVEFKVRSVILGEGRGEGGGVEDVSSNLMNEGAASPGAKEGGDEARKQAHVAGKMRGMIHGTAAGEAKLRPGAGRLGVFPTGYEQVKAFLADARPVSIQRPASAPAHFDPGVRNGYVDSSGGGGGGSDGDRARATGLRGATVDESRRPCTAGAAVGGGGSRGGYNDHQRSPHPQMTLGSHPSSGPPLLARPSSRAVSGSVSGGGVRAANGSGIAAEGRVPPTSTAMAVHRTDAGATANLMNDRNRDNSTLFYHRSTTVVPGGGISETAARGRVAMQGKRPILLPRPTLAAHNGRLFMEQERFFAGLQRIDSTEGGGVAGCFVGK